MSTNKKIREKLLEMFSQPTMHRKVEEIRKQTGNSISKEVAHDVLAAINNVDVYSVLKNEEGREQEIKEFSESMARFDFGNGVILRKPTIVNNTAEDREDRSPYDLPLTRYDLDAELVADCKVQKPYRKAVSEALLTLETRIRATLGLPDTYTGAALITEANKRGIFKRTVPAEEQGLYFLFMGAFNWLRNPPGHKKVEYTKEEAVKVVLFTDYLIKLFDDLFNKRI